jgi:hypothetical protein
MRNDAPIGDARRRDSEAMTIEDSMLHHGFLPYCTNPDGSMLFIGSVDPDIVKSVKSEYLKGSKHEGTYADNKD